MSFRLFSEHIPSVNFIWKGQPLCRFSTGHNFIRCRAVSFILVAALFLFARPSLAVPSATTALFCDNTLLVDVFQSVSCGQVLNRPQNLFRFEERASASVSRGIPPEVRATATAEAETFSGVPGGQSNSDADIDATAAGTFSAQISQTSPPPFTPNTFPVIVFIEGALDADALPGSFGQAEAFADALVRARGAFVVDELFSLNVTNGFDSMPIARALQRNCFTNCAVEFTKAVSVDVFAFVQTPTDVSASSTARAEARIDPFLAFDQNTFDQIHGSSSFLLEDFYSFIYSPNLTVPEPTTLLLLGLGLAGLGFARMRQH